MHRCSLRVSLSFHLTGKRVRGEGQVKAGISGSCRDIQPGCRRAAVCPWQGRALKLQSRAAALKKSIAFILTCIFCIASLFTKQFTDIHNIGYLHCHSPIHKCRHKCVIVGSTGQRHIVCLESFSSSVYRSLAKGSTHCFQSSRTCIKEQGYWASWTAALCETLEDGPKQHELF